MGRIKLMFGGVIMLFLLGLSGCSNLVTGFRELSYEKESQAKELYGSGKYYQFAARGSDLRSVSPEDYSQYGKEYGIKAITSLISNFMKENKVCPNDYVVIEDTLGYFEGGSASIFIRCE